MHTFKNVGDLNCMENFVNLPDHIDLTKFEPTGEQSVPPPCASAYYASQGWPDAPSPTAPKNGWSREVRFDLSVEIDDMKDASGQPYQKGGSRVKR